MKKILLTLTLTIIVFANQYGQTGNSCNDPIEIIAGTYTVDGINGDSYDVNCTEYDAENGQLIWHSYSPDQDYLVTVSSDLSVNDGVDTRFHVFAGDCENLSCSGGDDDSGDGYLSHGSFYAYSGITYYIVWDDRWGDESFEFTVEENIPPPPPTFGFTQVNVNSTGSERGMVDMNGDGLDDLVSIQTTNINLLIQAQEGGFEEVNISTENADYAPSWSMAAGDFDRNGFNDLLYGGGNGVTFMKANEDGTAYSEISGSEYVFSQRSNFVDINNDGHLDAFVCHDIQPNVYYINDGSGNLQFFQGPNEDGVSSGIGGVEYELAPYPGEQEGGNYGSIWIDFDNDRDIDLFIAKCRGGDIQWKNNELWRNNGDGTFSNIADNTGYYSSYYPDGGHDNSSNLGDPVQTWSSAWGDFNNDGFMDVYVGASATGDGGHKLMQNNGDGTFSDRTEGSGIEDAAFGIENDSGDFNNDGLVDILSNGSILQNNGDFTFTVYSVGMPGPGAIGDSNNDGFLDVFNGNSLYQNNSNGNNWLKVVTTGTASNINGIGARIEILSSGIGTQIRDVRSGTGFRYMGSLNTYFGLGEDSNITSLTVYWPSGTIDVLNNVSVNQSIIIVEGETLSIENSSIEDFRIYPNPADDFVTVETSVSLEGAIISLFDVNGRRVLNYKKNTENNKIDISNLNAGEYILRIVSSEGNVLSEKLLIR